VTPLLAYAAVGALVALSWCVAAGRAGGAHLVITPLQALALGAAWPLAVAVWFGEASRRGRARRMRHAWEGWR
jgi:hypothetical protein